MKCFTYIVARDFGFAPNPFGGFCTLATCKPKIRNSAKVGDWVIGVGSAKMRLRGELIFAMKVTEKLTYNEYWNDIRFQFKRPAMNCSKKKAYGDNIYFYDDIKNTWFQADSHHSNSDGSTNYHNLDRDTQSSEVLISENFYYFGKYRLTLPTEFNEQVCHGRGHKNITDEIDIEKIIKWLERNFTINYLYGMPIQFDSIFFKRYDGKS
jgi:Nucleotide modification associated domain 2